MNGQEKPIFGPSCETCWKREQCDIRTDDTAFCSQWARTQPKDPERPDPWERGLTLDEWMGGM